MKTQLEQRLKELRSEYESGQKILTDIENKLEELEARKISLNETLLKIIGAIELLEEILGVEEESCCKENAGAEEPEMEPGTGVVEVPVVIRKPLEQAQKILKDAGLVVGEISEKSIFIAGLRFGDVVQQDPKPGTKVEKGSAVNLVLATKGKFKPDLGKDSKLNAFSMH